MMGQLLHYYYQQYCMSEHQDHQQTDTQEETHHQQKLIQGEQDGEAQTQETSQKDQGEIFESHEEIRDSNTGESTEPTAEYIVAEGEKVEESGQVVEEDNTNEEKGENVTGEGNQKKKKKKNKNKNKEGNQGVIGQEEKKEETGTVEVIPYESTGQVEIQAEQIRESQNLDQENTESQKEQSQHEQLQHQEPQQPQEQPQLEEPREQQEPERYEPSQEREQGQQENQNEGNPNNQETQYLQQTETQQPESIEQKQEENQEPNNENEETPVNEPQHNEQHEPGTIKYSNNEEPEQNQQPEHTEQTEHTEQIGQTQEYQPQPDVEEERNDIPETQETQVIYNQENQENQENYDIKPIVTENEEREEEQTPQQLEINNQIPTKIEDDEPVHVQQTHQKVEETHAPETQQEDQVEETQPVETVHAVVVEDNLEQRADVKEDLPNPSEPAHEHVEEQPKERQSELEEEQPRENKLKNSIQLEPEIYDSRIVPSPEIQVQAAPQEVVTKVVVPEPVEEKSAMRLLAQNPETKKDIKLINKPESAFNPSEGSQTRKKREQLDTKDNSSCTCLLF